MMTTFVLVVLGIVAVTAIVGSAINRFRLNRFRANLSVGDAVLYKAAGGEWVTGYVDIVYRQNPNPKLHSVDVGPSIRRLSQVFPVR